MTKTSSAYALAAFEHAKASNSLDGWYALLSQLVSLRHPSFKNPHVSWENIEAIVQKEIPLSDDQKTWFQLLQKHKHLHLLPRICEKFVAHYYKDTHNYPMVVTTARPLSSEEQTLFGKKLNKNDITFAVDSSILGGVLIEYRGQVIDHSYINFLNQLHTKT